MAEKINLPYWKLIFSAGGKLRLIARAVVSENLP